MVEATAGHVPGTSHVASRPEFANFDYLRLFAAAAVLLGHAIVVAEGGDRHDPLVWLTGKDIPIGTYAVCIFFIISGFLVTRSAVEGRFLPAFLAGRILRIYPGLFVCQLLTALVIGGMFTHLDYVAYLRHEYAWNYAIQYTLDPGMTWNVPSVAFYHDRGLDGVSFNASLWSIQQELFCYLAVALLMLFRLLDWRAYLVLLLLSLPFFVPWSRDNVDMLMDLFDWSFAEQRLAEYFWVGSSFFTGGILYFYRRRRNGFPHWPLTVCALIFLLAAVQNRAYSYFPLYAAYPLLYWATSPSAQLPSLKRVGDLSYGIYLYGWPYEQTVRGVLGPGVTWWQVMLLAGILSTTTAYFSWHLIERPALSLKLFFYRRPRKIAQNSPAQATAACHEE